MSDKPDQVYLLRKEELGLVREEVKGQACRAEHLIQQFYTGNQHLTHQVLLYLFELVVSSYSYIDLLETILQSPVVAKEGKEGFKVEKGSILSMATYTAISKNIRADLAELGLVVDLQ